MKTFNYNFVFSRTFNNDVYLRTFKSIFLTLWFIIIHIWYCMYKRCIGIKLNLCKLYLSEIIELY